MRHSPALRWAGGPLLALVLLAGALPAHAALFEDDEARKAILELRTKLDDQRRAAEQTNEQLRRSLVDLNGQIEALRSEVARMRGENEQLARDVAELQRAQKDVAQGVDERMRKLEPQKVTLDGKEFLADPEEKRQYDEAVATLRGGDFAGASIAFGNFVKRHPSSGYADSARFWLGNALYGKRDYKEAIAAFRAFLAAAPTSLRAPEAMLALANTQIETKDTKGARVTLNELIKAYPSSEAAQAARERLVALKP
jgi:tol-pal system protein YbgF